MTVRVRVPWAWRLCVLLLGVAVVVQGCTLRDVNDTVATQNRTIRLQVDTICLLMERENQDCTERPRAEPRPRQ